MNKAEELILLQVCKQMFEKLYKRTGSKDMVTTFNVKDRTVNILTPGKQFFSTFDEANIPPLGDQLPNAHTVYVISDETEFSLAINDIKKNIIFSCKFKMSEING